MSAHDQAAVAIVAQIALAADGAVLGIAVAYVAVRSLLRYSFASSALRRIRKAPSHSVADLRSLLADSGFQPSSDSPEPQSTSQASSDETLVIVRGSVDAKSTVDGSWKSLRPNILVSHESGEKGVVLQRTQTCIYNEWRGFFGWTSDLRALFTRSWKGQESSSLRTVPFILVDTGHRPQTNYILVNMDGSRHPLPLTTVYHQLQPINATPYTFLQAVFGHEYPVGLLDEEKILPLGKEISAVGFCSLKNGTPEIISCKDLPYFLSDMTKDQMVVELAFKTRILLWTGIVLGSLSIGILSYAAIRNWRKWKNWLHQRRFQRENHFVADAADFADDNDSGEVPDGQLCVICLMRRRQSAFLPCGHLVCCRRCALSVEQEVSPKCPVCRQAVGNSVRIYDT